MQFLNLEIPTPIPAANPPRGNVLIHMHRRIMQRRTGNPKYLETSFPPVKEPPLDMSVDLSVFGISTIEFRLVLHPR